MNFVFINLLSFCFFAHHTTKMSRQFVKAAIQVWKQSAQVSYLDSVSENVQNANQFPRSMIGTKKWSINIVNAETNVVLFKLHFMKLPEQSQTLRLKKVSMDGTFGFANVQITANNFFLSGADAQTFGSGSMFFIVWTCPSTMLSLYAPGSDYQDNINPPVNPGQFQAQNAQMLMTAGVYKNIMSPVFATTNMILHSGTGKMTKGNGYNNEFHLGGSSHVNRVLQTNDAVCITFIARPTPSTLLTYPNFAQDDIP